MDYINISKPPFQQPGGLCDDIFLREGVLFYPIDMLLSPVNNFARVCVMIE
jgi:hypothetical protein